MVQTSLLMVLIVTLGSNRLIVESKRGPHHPRSEPLGKGGGAVDVHIVHNDEHLKADLSAAKVRMEKPLEEMTAEEKQFYHFKMHDYDNNNLLDGLEILQSANVHDDTFHKKLDATRLDQQQSANDGGEAAAAAEVEEPGDNNSVHEQRDIQHLVDIIDDFLLYADKNNDGFLNFNEYKESLQAAAHDDDHPHQDQGAGDGEFSSSTPARTDDLDSGDMDSDADNELNTNSLV